jgi:hypothetical protein
MKKINLIVITFFILFNNFIFLNLYAQIKNVIVVKVGSSLITSVDVENEIITNLIVNKLEVTQENINKNKNFAIKNLIKKRIKRSEINIYKIKDYNKQDLINYAENIAKNLDTNSNGLKEIFNQYNVNYEIFIEKHETDLLWNTLIFKLYQNQTNVNIIEVDNEFEKFKENKTEDELKLLKKNILNKKKEDKLNLFSRSHFSNLENTVVVSFQ